MAEEVKKSEDANSPEVVDEESEGGMISTIRNNTRKVLLPVLLFLTALSAMSAYYTQQLLKLSQHQVEYQKATIEDLKGLIIEQDGVLVLQRQLAEKNATIQQLQEETIREQSKVIGESTVFIKKEQSMLVGCVKNLDRCSQSLDQSTQDIGRCTQGLGTCVQKLVPSR